MICTFSPHCYLPSGHMGRCVDIRSGWRTQYQNNPKFPARCDSRNILTGRRCILRAGHRPPLHRSSWRSCTEQYTSTVFGVPKTFYSGDQPKDQENFPAPEPPRFFVDFEGPKFDYAFPGFYPPIPSGPADGDGCKFHTAGIGATAGAPGSGCNSGRFPSVPTAEDPICSHVISAEKISRLFDEGKFAPARIAIKVLRARDMIEKNESRIPVSPNIPPIFVWQELVQRSTNLILDWINIPGASKPPADLFLARYISSLHTSMLDTQPLGSSYLPTSLQWDVVVSEAERTVRAWAKTVGPTEYRVVYGTCDYFNHHRDHTEKVTCRNWRPNR